MTPSGALPSFAGMQRRVFVGFGFGAIQGGLFLYEAHRSGNFHRLVVAEVVPEVVARVRNNGGAYRVNVATATGLEVHTVTGVEIFNPNVPADRAEVVRAVREACEICTALPSVEFFGSVAPLLADGFSGKEMPAVVYTAENNNHAAEILERTVGPVNAPVQFLNTVIGKMSGVTESRELLVEEFNRILISKITLPGFRRGIEVFSEKPDLLPFEEAKLYGHNAVHALLGYLANERGLEFMSEIDAELLEFGRQAFLEESGPALIAKHAGVDPLFTPAGYRAYAEDLLPRMVNPRTGRVHTTYGQAVAVTPIQLATAYAAMVKSAPCPRTVIPAVNRDASRGSSSAPSAMFSRSRNTAIVALVSLLDIKTDAQPATSTGTCAAPAASSAPRTLAIMPPVISPRSIMACVEVASSWGTTRPEASFTPGTSVSSASREAGSRRAMAAAASSAFTFTVWPVGVSARDAITGILASWTQPYGSVHASWTCWAAPSG